MSITKQVHKELSELDEFFGRTARAPITSIESYIKYNTFKQNEVIKLSSESLVNDINISTQNICGTLQEGFENLFQINNNINENLKTINNGIEEVNLNLEDIKYTLEWGMSSLIESSTITNQRLDDIIQLLNVPDIQKKRKYYLEQGISFLVKGVSNNIFIEKAITNFEKALSIEDSDYFALYQLGFIHLFFKEYLDIDKSKEFLKKAILFGEADAKFGNKSLGTHSSSTEFNFSSKVIASNAYMYLAQILYREGEIKKALDLSYKGMDLGSNNIRLAFDQCKYGVDLVDGNLIVSSLKVLIEDFDRHITLRVLSDKDLMRSKDVKIYLNELSNTTNELALNEYRKIEMEIKANSIYSLELNEIEKLINKKQYLSSLSALERMGYELEN